MIPSLSSLSVIGPSVMSGGRGRVALSGGPECGPRVGALSEAALTRARGHEGEQPPRRPFTHAIKPKRPRKTPTFGLFARVKGPGGERAGGERAGGERAGGERAGGERPGGERARRRRGGWSKGAGDALASDAADEVNGFDIALRAIGYFVKGGGVVRMVDYGVRNERRHDPHQQFVVAEHIELPYFAVDVEHEMKSGVERNDCFAARVTVVSAESARGHVEQDLFVGGEVVWQRQVVELQRPKPVVSSKAGLKSDGLHPSDRNAVGSVNEVSGSDARYKTVLFDWDGCLAQSLDMWMDAYRATCTSFDVYPSDEAIAHQFGDWEGPTAFGVHHERVDAFMAALVDEMNLSLPNVALYPGADRLIEALRANGIRIAMITSSTRANVKHATSKNGFDAHFDLIVTADDVDNHKPHPEPLHKAIDVLGSDPTTTVMIGDSAKDIGAAVNAGVDSILTHPPSHDRFYDLAALRLLNPTYVCTSLHEVHSVLLGN